MSCTRHDVDNVKEHRQLHTKTFTFVKSGVKFCAAEDFDGQNLLGKMETK